MPAPPDGHPRQCRANSRVTRKRCKRWALTGTNFCQFHGGRRATQFVFVKARGRYKLPSFYSKYLGPRLSELVQDSLNRPHDEQVALYEELAITRSLACEALKLAAPLFDDEASKKLTPETKALIMATLNNSMSQVKDLVLAAARVEKAQEDKVSLKVINLIIHQIMRAINDVCGAENLDLVEAIGRAIDERVRLPINDKLAPNVELNLIEAEVLPDGDTA